MTTPRPFRQTLLLAAALATLAGPAWAEGFKTGSQWDGAIFRDAKGQVKSCAAVQKFDTGTTLSFALTRDKDLFLVLQNTAIDLPKGERVPIAYAIDRGLAYTTQAYVVRDSVVLDLPNTPAVRDLLSAGSMLSVEGAERTEEFSLKGVAESLKALATCLEQPQPVATAAAKPPQVEPPRPAAAPAPAPAPAAPPPAPPAVVAAAPPPPPAPPPAAAPAPPPEAPAAEAAPPEPKAKAEPAPQPTATQPTATPGGLQAQLGTYMSETRAGAEWGRLKKRVAPVLDSYEPIFVPQVRSTDGQTLTLVRVGPFASRDEASRFCDEVKAKGHPDCKPILRP